MDQEVLVKKMFIGGKNNICHLQLNRLECANAYDEEVLSVLDVTLHQLRQERMVRAVIVSGTGERAFCAGADQREPLKQRLTNEIDLRSRVVFDNLAELPIPTIACINGAAIGGGLELALACDLRVCSSTAVFELPELSMGIVPAAGAMRRLPSIVGKGRAAEMILFQRKIDAFTAHVWGLVAYQGDNYRDQALILAEQVARLDPMATLLAKKILNTDVNPMQHDLETVSQAFLYGRKLQEVTV